MDAENTYRVFDWLWTSGQLSERNIAGLPALGIESVINLAMPSSSNALQGEAELVSLRGINYFHIPVVWEAPRLDDLRTFCAVLDALNGRKTWVHCAKNMRVSAFIYLYRKLRMGDADEQARFPLREVWTPNDTWQQFIDHALVGDPSIAKIQASQSTAAASRRPDRDSLLSSSTAAQIKRTGHRFV